MTDEYLFRSERLGFRNWRETDINAMAAINMDPQVMKFFPGIKSYAQTRDFVERMQMQMVEKHYCYFAVDKLEDGGFIGFIGISEQVFESPFTPCADLGWRLKSSEWGKGYATEGARRCLEYGFNYLGLAKINAMAPKINLRSEGIMKKIGMKKVGDFIHPLLINDDRLRECVLYELSKSR